MFHGLGEGHDKDDRIRLTEGLVLPAPQSTMVKTKFVKEKKSGTLILAIYYGSIQSYFKVCLILTILFYVYFLYLKIMSLLGH